MRKTILEWVQSGGRATARIMGRNSRLSAGLRPVYERMLGLLSLGKGIPWRVNGETFFIDPRFRTHFAPEHDPEVASFLKNGVAEGALIFNIGANLGVYALQLARMVGERGKVIACEPNPTARSALLRHIEWNRLEHVIEVIGSAVGDREGTVDFYAHEADGMSAAGAPNPLLGDRHERLLVPLTTIDALCEERKCSPSWLVVDVEGFEIRVLSGAQRLLGKRSARWVVELHPQAWEQVGSHREQLVTLLAEHDYRLAPLMGQQDPLNEHGIVALEPIP